MRSSGRESWQVRLDDLPQHLVAALYVRDAADLSPVDGPPPLMPSVPPVLRPTDPPACAEEWSRWWTRLLVFGDGDRDGDAEGVHRWVQAGADPYTVGSAESPQLAVIHERLGREPLLWASRLRKQAHLGPDGSLDARARGGAEPLLIPRLVADIERELGRRARPVALRVDVLPVVGDWWQMPTATHLLVSQDVVADADAWRTLLGEVLRPRL